MATPLRPHSAKASRDERGSAGHGKTLVILDAHAVIHRAYHALPSFTNSAGVPTGALYGIVSMLIRIVEDLKPDAIVAAYDLPKPTFRHLAYDDYKKGRVKADDDLVAQLQSSRELFKAFGIECLDAEGFEADDVIGTLVEQFKKDKDVSIIIASGDMDTLQLVDDKKVQVFTLRKGVTDTVLYDEDGVVARYGFKPPQLVDYKGLRGDPSDNIIGVPGIGEKTATSIIQTFGSIEALYKELEKPARPHDGSGAGGDNPKLKDAGLTPRIIGVLKEHKDDAFFSKTLATIRRDAPVAFTIPETPYKQMVNQEKVMEKVSEYEFRSLVPRLKKLFAFEEQGPTEEVDPELLKLASIGLWVLYSENTNPPYEAILERTHKKTLAEAYDAIVAELKKKNLFTLFETIEKPLIPIIVRMQEWGIMIDRPFFEKLRERMLETLARIEKEVVELTGDSINLNSPKQLSELLFGKLGLKPKGKQKASGAYTTNAETLESLVDAHPIIPKILEHREVQKLLSTYVEALLACADNKDTVHSTFVQHGAATGRFSSTNPNLQNIPIKGEGGMEIRHGFVARKGHVFIGSDYSQIELRVLAMLSRDTQLIDTFARGEDIHARVASAMFNVPLAEVTNDMRRKAKVINFGILYGMGVSALQKNLGSTRQEAATYYEQYFATFPTIHDYIERTKALAREQGFTETMFGRRRYFPGINAAAPFMRAFAERMAVNAPIQGTNADIVKLAIIMIDEDLRAAGLIDKVHLTLQIHDELVYEVEEVVKDEAQEIITKAMTDVFLRSPIKAKEETVPLGVSVGIGHRLDELK